jgi:hypothetical protein
LQGYKLVKVIASFKDFLVKKCKLIKVFPNYVAVVVVVVVVV